ncbi:TPA: hypothetical protein RNX31_002117 [Pasteurella multocida]|nr:hypothetical protein [Pasteurella multocida]
MAHSLLTVQRKILVPRNDIDFCLDPHEGEIIVLSIPARFSSKTIEVYELNGRYEWRIVEIITTEAGGKRKKVLYDSFESIYRDPYIALADAILFELSNETGD